MTRAASPEPQIQVESPAAAIVRAGLTSFPKHLPPWLFYDAAGSQLFEQITELPEYYLTRTERAILAARGATMMAQAAGDARLRIVELGAGSADKTRLLLQAAVERQGSVVYEPVDVSASSLKLARQRIEREIPGVHVAPRVEDYTRGLELAQEAADERRLVLYIGSSIGNFEPDEAVELLQRVRAALQPGDCLLLGVDLVKDERTLLAAYDDAAGVTAAFNRNLLVRLNREFAADFDPESFAHCAVWNPEKSRMEMHLESRVAQRVQLEALELDVHFAAGERIHTENSYKYKPGQAAAMLAEAGFHAESRWTDAREWFAVLLARAAG